eukprot:COSAG02_NODE_35162_length_472_cov_7.193029_1_plen_86_part_10
MTCRCGWPVYPHAALTRTNLWRQAAIEDITGPPDSTSRECVPGAAVGARARALLAVGLQIQDHLADDLADHLSLFWLNTNSVNLII